MANVELSGNDILALLRRGDNDKNECAKNIRTARRIAKPLGDARKREKYVDSRVPAIASVAVMGRGSAGLNKEGRAYGHVAVVTEIDEAGKNVRLFDGPNAFHFRTKMNNVSGYITPNKMVELGSAINFTKPKPTLTMGEYEAIYKKRYPSGGTIYTNLEAASAKFGDIAYFVAIGAERAAAKNGLAK